jgi:hypothetical protein
MRPSSTWLPSEYSMSTVYSEYSMSTVYSEYSMSTVYSEYSISGGMRPSSTCLPIVSTV